MNELTHQVSVSTEQAILLHSHAEEQYAVCLKLADSIDRYAERFGDDRLPGAPAVFRGTAEQWRTIGQQIEVLIPGLEPGDWRWPQS